MIFFKNNASANYEKVFYDFTINDVSGNKLNLNNYKNKVILLVNTASYCGFTNSMMIYNIFGRNIKIKISLC